jgi:hypothetical protein
MCTCRLKQPDPIEFLIRDLGEPGVHRTHLAFKAPGERSWIHSEAVEMSQVIALGTSHLVACLLSP